MCISSPAHLTCAATGSFSERRPFFILDRRSSAPASTRRVFEEEFVHSVSKKRKGQLVLHLDQITITTVHVAAVASGKHLPTCRTHSLLV